MQEEAPERCELHDPVSGEYSERSEPRSISHAEKESVVRRIYNTDLCCVHFDDMEQDLTAV